jgi:O-antigen ligase
LTALVPLALLVLVLPFEPMAPLARILSFEVSHLEAAALVLLAVAAPGLVRQKMPVPLLAPALALLGAYVLSAALAGGDVLPWKFTLRMAAGVVAFCVTSLALARASKIDKLLLAFAVAGTATAALAILEAGFPDAVEPLVGPFREHSFEVGGRARVAGTFSYPNTAAGFLVLALAPAAGFLVRGKHSALAFSASLTIFLAILLTYSRGALLGAVAAIALLHVLLRSSRLLWLSGAFALSAVVLFAAEPSFRWRASAEGDRSWYLAAIEPEADALDLVPGALSETGVTVRNAGKLTWESAGARPFHLSYRWFRPAGEALEPIPIEGERTPLESPLKPGEAIELRARVRAPSAPGSYVLVWDMVHEHTTWFSDKLGLGAPVHVVVGEGARRGVRPVSEIGRYLAESSYRPGRRELWGIALGLFRSRPILGVGPDNFRWLYGEAAGRKTWDTRIYSNSLYLELLATVGLLGFGGFVLLAGGALSGLVGKKGSLESAVLAASLTGFLVHGIFDYLLAFTPIYLAFFMLMGAGSAALREEGA